MTSPLFLKLGGSLITDKTRPYQPHLDRLAALAGELAAFLKDHPSRRLLLGHGSGSFGHTAAAEHGTREGVHDEQGWRGFAEVHHQAALLNRHVMDALHSAGIPAMAFPPVASVIAREGKVTSWDTAPLHDALENGLLPVIYGDTVVDEVRGGTILSTEDLFSHLAPVLGPARILLAGQEPGVWADFPSRAHLLNVIHADSGESLHGSLGASAGVDVTGGMLSKVEQMLELVRSLPGLQVTIFSAEKPGALLKALENEQIGTRLLL